MEELLTIDSTSDFPVDGRNLHGQLGIGTEYRHWFPRMCEYGFLEDVDFRSKMNESTGGRPAENHDMTIGMAKEICMLQRTEQGREIRRHLIKIENQWNQPECVMARALQMAEKTINQLKGKTLQLEAANSELTVKTQIMQPKAEYFDDLVERGVNSGIRETAKQLGVKERAFVDFLLSGKYLYRDKKKKLVPFAQYADDLFVLKECFNEKTDWGGTQTLVTPKGKETFRLLTVGLTK